MEILSALKIDATILYQFACFVVAYLALSTLIFKPYLAAFQERANRTVGGEEQAEHLMAETQALQAQYETRAREINQKFKAIYDQSRTATLREQETLIAQARSQAVELVEKNRTQIETELTSARKDLERQAPAVGLAIASKLVGKELVQ